MDKDEAQLFSQCEMLTKGTRGIEIGKAERAFSR